MYDRLTLAFIEQAAERIQPHLRPTPVLERELADATLLLKAECLQPTGAFKLRGAFNKLLSLPDDGSGVVAHSSGNHAQAVARAARILDRPATIVMPSDAPPVKVARTAADGANIVRVGPDSNERKSRAAELAKLHGLHPVDPYNDPYIAAGQGTAALELLKDVGSIDRFYAPVSGGGLMSGCSVVVAALHPSAEIIAVEPSGKDAFKRSMEAGERCAVDEARTIADGLRVRIPGDQTWEVLKRRVHRAITVTDEEMVEAMAWAMRELRVVLEPSGATALAGAMREGRGRCGVILTGGNLSDEMLHQAAMMPEDHTP